MLQDKSLDELRGKIDKIDDALHDLLIYRGEVTEAIARAKRSNGPSVAPAMRPGREAQILRRLLARHRGNLPRRFILRVWREIIASSLQLQASFQLHVYSGDDKQGFSDLAAAYFGSLTPIRSHTRASLVLQACADEPHCLGIVPIPQGEEAGVPWWAQLAPAGTPGPRIIAKLPFIVDGEGTLSAYALGAVEQEETGDDTTLIRLETAPGFSRANLSTMLKNAGLDAHTVAGGRTADKKGGMVLLAANGFVGPSDPRLERLRRDLGESVPVLVTVGGFANPLVMAAETAR